MSKASYNPKITRMPFATLLNKLHYQTAPGIHTYTCNGCPKCGGDTRGEGFCTACIDAELRRRKVDITKLRYERIGDNLRRIQ